MPLRKNITFDPQTNEYLFDIFSSLSPAQKAMLNDKELNYFRTGKDLKRFINFDDLDRKLSFFTKTGFDWALLFFDPQKFSMEDIKKAYRQKSVEGLEVELIDKMIREKTFVLTSKVVALGMMMMGNNAHSEVFRINRNFLRVGEDMGQLGKQMAEKNRNVEWLTSQKSLLRMTRIIMAILNIPNYLNTVHGLQLTDLAIFCVLFQRPHSFYREDAIQRKIKPLFKQVTIAGRCRKLFDLGYLEKVPTSTTKPAFQIKAKGLLVLGDVLNRIVNQIDTEL